MTRPGAARTCLALRHVPFEDLGTFGPRLEAAGYALRYVEVGLAELGALDVLSPDLLVTSRNREMILDPSTLEIYSERQRSEKKTSDNPETLKQIEPVGTQPDSNPHTPTLYRESAVRSRCRSRHT